MSFNEKLYDDLFKEASNFLKKYNPCKIQNGYCLRNHKYGERNFCCGGCPHLTLNGCKAEKPLMCKLWLCDYALKELSPEVRKEFFVLSNKISKEGFYKYRTTKEDMRNIFSDEREEEEKEDEEDYRKYLIREI
jgi:hypothetical protein